jgi:glutathione S-transferase
MPAHGADVHAPRIASPAQGFGALSVWPLHLPAILHPPCENRRRQAPLAAGEHSPAAAHAACRGCPLQAKCRLVQPVRTRTGPVCHEQGTTDGRRVHHPSWSLRGRLMACIADLEFTEVMVSPDDADARNKLLLLAPSIRLPCLTHDGAKVWNMLAIAQYLKEIVPDAGLMPDDRIARGHCYSVGGEMTSGFDNLRAALPMHLKARRPRHKVSPGAQPDIDRIVEFWTDCLATHGRPFLFGKQRGMADAMHAPVATRLLTCDLKLNNACAQSCQTIMAMTR